MLGDISRNRNCIHLIENFCLWKKIVSRLKFENVFTLRSLYQKVLYIKFNGRFSINIKSAVNTAVCDMFFFVIFEWLLMIVIVIVDGWGRLHTLV